ncbi:hypothetical protein B0J11DRAFT_136353 [Dendryphion nanum]|uniref:DUF7730 domain-containing protein n=1 Tax=Dendryphion nanum TaxID=256645 RepID=A0A9P9D7Y1_9PLEO|nr:hypothetical protein B0J11DRAFT_136353 [Dendryphion nanum]
MAPLRANPAVIIEFTISKTTQPTIRKRKLNPFFKPPIQSPFPLLKLPAEIRNRIYEFALVDPVSTISINYCTKSTYSPGLQVSRELMKKTDWDAAKRYLSKSEKDQIKGTKQLKKWDMNAQISPNLLYTCRQINYEATYFLYGKNNLMFLDLIVLDKFLVHCNRYLHLISCITLAFMEKGDKQLQATKFNKLNKVVNLESLILEKGFLRALPYTRGSGSEAAVSFFQLANNWIWNTALSLGSKEAIFKRICFPKRFGGGYQGKAQDSQFFTRLKVRFGDSVAMEDPARFENEFRLKLLELMD